MLGFMKTVLQVPKEEAEAEVPLLFDAGKQHGFNVSSLQ